MMATNAISIDTTTGDTKDVVVIQEIVISRRHYDVLAELAALNEIDITKFLSDEIEFAIEDMAFNDPDHIAKLMGRKWKKELGKE